MNACLETLFLFPTDPISTCQQALLLSPYPWRFFLRVIAWSFYSMLIIFMVVFYSRNFFSDTLFLFLSLSRFRWWKIFVNHHFVICNLSLIKNSYIIDLHFIGFLFQSLQHITDKSHKLWNLVFYPKIIYMVT